MEAARAPQTRYAKSGELHIAYRVVGDGPLDLVYVPTWISHVELPWEEPTIARYFDRIAEFARLIVFDRRGAGLSDPMVGAPTLEEQMDDVIAVMDAAGCERAALFAQAEGASMAAMFAATHPERVTALVLFAGWARLLWDEDYTWANTAEERQSLLDHMIENWGIGDWSVGLVPSRANDRRFIEWFNKLQRNGASPATARAIMEAIGGTDVRGILPTIRVPTLVITRTDEPLINPQHSRYLAEHIPDAKLVELPGSDSLAMTEDADTILELTEEFLTGARHRREPDRVLATVMFTDIVRSTELAAQLGDRRWRDVLERHDQLMREHIERNRGRAVKSTGDGILATFDGPARAIQAAKAATAEARDLGIEIRAGLHTGECEVIGDDVGGLAVHIGARVSQCADAGEVLVSGTVKDLVVGSGIDFADRGERELKGVPGQWRLYAVA